MNGSEVDADLMGPAGMGLGIHQRGVMKAPRHPVERKGVSRRDAVHLHSRPFGWVSADGRLDFALLHLHSPVDQRVVVLVYGSRSELVCQRAMCGVVLGHHYQAGGHLVEAMNNPRPHLAGDGRKTVAQMEE